MKKQYMDFVPTKSGAKNTVRKTTSQPKVATKKAAGTRVAKTGSVSRTRVSDKVSFAGEKKAKLGEVENLNDRFVNSNVPKRPLSKTPHFVVAKTEVAKAKAQKVINRDRDAAKPKETKKVAVSKEYKVPKTPFINQDKVQKRPLSKNVYPKKQVKVSDTNQAPVTIIEKPEKQAHAGMIITIIITIILGAAAGTVAFLLLPK